MLAEGTVLANRYRIVGLLGVGGMASVFEAEHLGVGRRVALKLLHGAYAQNKELVARFEHEARTASHIAHDHIVEVLDVGTYRTLPFMVMELLRGESLAVRVENHDAMELTRACHIIDQVLEALEYVHAMGVIHRDLKPENIHLIELAGIVDFVKILDFGVSKAQLESRAHARTRSGVVMGTPHYMAPEQAIARRDADHRVDLYAAGVMLYEMVTGTLPIEASNTTELLVELVNRTAPLPRASTMLAIMPRALDDAIARAIALPRDERFASASEFREAIAPFVPARADDGRANSSVPPFPLERMVVQPLSEESEDARGLRASVPTLHAWGEGDLPRVEPSVPPPASADSPPVDPPPRFVPRAPAPPAPPAPPVAAPEPAPPEALRRTDTPRSANPAAIRVAHESSVTVPPTEVSPRKSSEAITVPRATGAPSWRLMASALAVGLCLGAAVTLPLRARKALAGAPQTPTLAAQPDPNTRVRIEGLPPGARVTLDGVEASSRAATLLRGSQYHVHVDADGFTPFDGDLVAQEAVWVFALSPLPQRPSAAPAAAPPAPAAAPLAPAAAAPAAASDATGRHHHHRRHRTG